MIREAGEQGRSKGSTRREAGAKRSHRPRPRKRALGVDGIPGWWNESTSLLSQQRATVRRRSAGAGRMGGRASDPGRLVPRERPAAAESLCDEKPSTAALRPNERPQAHGRTTKKTRSQDREPTPVFKLNRYTSTVETTLSDLAICAIASSSVITAKSS